MLLHCVSNYPADPATTNLRAMHTLRTAFGIPVGFSDHTQGISVSLAAVALGANAIEKHFTLDRGLAGPDHGASLEPHELLEMTASIRVVESSLGDGRKRPTAAEKITATVARKSLVLARDVTAGEILRSEDLVRLRPGDGLAPEIEPYVVGRSMRLSAAAGTMLTLAMLA